VFARAEAGVGAGGLRSWKWHPALSPHSPRKSVCAIYLNSEQMKWFTLLVEKTLTFALNLDNSAVAAKHLKNLVSMLINIDISGYITTSFYKYQPIKIRKRYYLRLTRFFPFCTILQQVLLLFTSR